MKKQLTYILAIVAVVVALNVLTANVFFRLDLTSEGRFTLSETTKNYLSQTASDVYITSYLGGELNSGFARLSKSAREMMDEMAVYANGDVVRKNVDPSQMNKAEAKAFADELEAMGIGGVPVYETKEDGQKTCTIVYPYLRIETADMSLWINLLENQPGVSAEENLNRSIESLEYKIADGIRRATTTERPRIAFLEGHGELGEIDVVEATDALSMHFAVDRGQLTGDASALDAYKAVIIAKPTQKFSEQDKFIIDQYLMRGGRLLWLVDAVTITLDSLRQSPHTIGLAADYNIEDMLFRYGVRINPEVVEDINCGMVPISVEVGGSAKIVPMPWRFAPMMLTNMLSPITRNVSVVKGDFASYIDTVGEALTLRRTELLRTSQFTKINPTPVFATLMNIHEQPNRAEFNRSGLCTALLEEGEFESVFAHRRVPKGVVNASEVLHKSLKTKMIVVSDGDVVRNDVRFRASENPTIVPLGYDEMTRQTYGNKDFVVNAVQYLTDDDGWMQLRNRTFTLRLLDKEKIGAGTTKWKVTAIAIPLIFISLCGLGVWLERRRRFAFNKKK